MKYEWKELVEGETLISYMSLVMFALVRMHVFMNRMHANFLLSGHKITMSARSVCSDVAPKIEKNCHFRPKPTY